MDREWRNDTNSIQEKWEFVLGNGFFSDIKFVVGEERQVLMCHSVILKLQSSVFEELLEKGYKIFNFPQYNPHILRLFLKYLYTENMTPTVDDAISILQLARKYKVPQLERICIIIVKDQITVQNCAMLFKMAHKYGEEELEVFILDFILGRIDQVFLTPGFLELSLECLVKLLVYSEGQRNELTAFQSLLKWGNAEMRRQGLEENEENLKLVLNFLLDLIDYESLSLKDFAEIVVPSGVLSQERMVQIFPYLTQADSHRNEVISAEEKTVDDVVFEPPKQITWYNLILYEPDVIDGWVWRDSAGPDVISFKVDRNIYVVGVKIYGHTGVGNYESWRPSKYNRTSKTFAKKGLLSGSDCVETSISISRFDNALLGTKLHNMRISETPGIIILKFGQPIPIAANSWTTISASVKCKTWCSRNAEADADLEFFHVKCGMDKLNFQIGDPSGFGNYIRPTRQITQVLLQY